MSHRDAMPQVCLAAGAFSDTGAGSCLESRRVSYDIIDLSKTFDYHFYNLYLSSRLQ